MQRIYSVGLLHEENLLKVSMFSKTILRETFLNSPMGEGLLKVFCDVEPILRISMDRRHPKGILRREGLAFCRDNSYEMSFHGENAFLRSSKCI